MLNKRLFAGFAIAGLVAATACAEPEPEIEPMVEDTMMTAPAMTPPPPLMSDTMMMGDTMMMEEDPEAMTP